MCSLLGPRHSCRVMHGCRIDGGGTRIVPEGWAAWVPRVNVVQDVCSLCSVIVSSVYYQICLLDAINVVRAVYCRCIFCSQ